MVGELEVVFHLHAVAAHLRVARHVLVLLEQLRRVAALAIILPIARLPDILRPLAPAAAPATALSVIDQKPLP